MSEHYLTAKQKLALPFKWTYDAKKVHYSITLELKALNDALVKKIPVDTDHEAFPTYRAWVDENLEKLAAELIAEHQEKLGSLEDQTEWREEQERRKEFTRLIEKMKEEEDKRQRQWNWESKEKKAARKIKTTGEHETI